MKTGIPPLVALAAGVMMFGCGNEPVLSPDVATDPLFGVSHGDSKSASSAPVVTFADPDGDPVGVAHTLRHDRGVSVELSTYLDPGTVATLWAVVFNEPSNCSPPGCGEDDLFEPGPVVDVMWTTGAVVKHKGTTTFTGNRAQGDNSYSLWAAFGLPSPGLIDSRAAEIHWIVRTHGPAISGLVYDMMNTFNAGCPNEGLPDDPLIGTPGPNTCEDIQFAVFQP